MPATERVAGWVLSNSVTKASVRFFVADGLVAREDRSQSQNWFLTETDNSQRNAVTATAAYEDAGYLLDGPPVVVLVLVKDLLILRKSASTGTRGDLAQVPDLPGATKNRLVKGLQAARFPLVEED